MILKYRAFCVFFVCILFLNFLPSVCLCSEDVPSLISEADQSLALAYAAVLELEYSGTNVSILLINLNVASNYLAEAYVWSNIGVPQKANSMASLCIEEVNDILVELELQKAEFQNNPISIENLRLFFSGIGVAIVLFFSFLVWFIFKNHYLRRIKEMKPEVIIHESSNVS